MRLDPNLWTRSEVDELAERTKAVYKQVTLTTDYTSEGNAFKKQLIVKLEDTLEACSEYIALYGECDERQPDASNTSTVFLN